MLFLNFKEDVNTRCSHIGFGSICFVQGFMQQSERNKELKEDSAAIKHYELARYYKMGNQVTE